MLPKRMSAIPSTTTGASNSVHRCLDMLADIEDTDAASAVVGKLIGLVLGGYKSAYIT